MIKTRGLVIDPEGELSSEMIAGSMLVETLAAEGGMVSLDPPWLEGWWIYVLMFSVHGHPAGLCIRTDQ